MDKCYIKILWSFLRYRKENRDIPSQVYWQQMRKYAKFARMFTEQKESWVHPITYLTATIRCISDKLLPSADPLDPILIVVVKDDLQRMQELFRHYRKIGFHQFVVLDNLSYDGTREYCVGQSDTRVHSVEDNYLTEKKEAWIERVITKIGIDRWYSIADSDEFLNYMNSEEKQVQELVRVAEDSGFRTVQAILLDMYQDGPLFSKLVFNRTMQEQWRFFDKDGYTSYLARHGIQRVLTGGPRVRALYSHEHMSKFPLLRYDKNTYLMTAHILWRFSKKEESPLWCVLQHYKFLEQDLKKYRERVKLKNFGAESRGYRTIMESYDSQPNISLMYSGSAEYIDSNSLRCLPLQPIPWKDTKGE